jgi:hypothetical protein
LVYWKSVSAFEMLALQSVYLTGSPITRLVVSDALVYQE